MVGRRIDRLLSLKLTAVPYIDLTETSWYSF